MIAREDIHSGETVLLSTQISTQNQTTVEHTPNAWADGGSVIACWHRTVFTTKQLYMTIELYEMWCSEIYDRDLISVGRIHDAMIQRGGGGGAGALEPQKYRVS